MKNLLLTFFTLLFTLPMLAQVCPTGSSEPTVLIAGDSWAQYMWDDGRYNQIFDKYGFNNKKMIAKSRGSNPGAGHTGPEYAISGSEAREWADRANYPWITNVINEITANPTIETVVLSIGGNDVLAAKSGGGWYQNMDLDVPGAEEALFASIKDDIMVIINDVRAVHPNVTFMISSYDYPNLSISGIGCLFYACAKRRDLSYDPDVVEVTDEELNQMMISVEEYRIQEIASVPNVYFDNAIGLTHYFYGDGNAAPGTLKYPVRQVPFGTDFYGGNAAVPTPRAHFRLFADPIHLNAASYEYKIINQTENYFFPWFRGTPDATIFSNGGMEDGYTTGTTSGTDAVRVGSATNDTYKGIISFDTGSIPDGSTIDKVSLFIQRQGQTGANPFSDAATYGAPMVDVKTGTFGAVTVENTDATAAADATDAGCFHGTVSRNDYALRIDLNAAGLAAINTEGITQFRIHFPTANGAEDFIDLKTGNAVLDNQVATQSLAEYLGNARPFLDINFTPPVQIDVKVALQGAYDSNTGMMSTKLNEKTYIPLIEPYTAMGLHNGTEETSLAVLAANPVVDWVLVELRDKTTPTTIIETRAGLLMENGDVLAANGTSLLAFSAAPDSYYVSIRHRNHLAVMSSSALALTPSSMVDFRSEPLFGTNATTNVNGIQVLWTGDTNLDNVVDAGDRSATWNDRNLSEYNDADCDFSGTVDASDRSITWNNRNRSAQLP